MHAQRRIFLAVVLASLFASRFAASASTAAGTAIGNVATVSYTTTTGAFIGTSNTLTSYVQNAPSLSVVPGGPQSITPSMIVVDTFTLINTGNNTAASNVFSLDAVAAFSGTGAPTLLGYTLTGSTCIVTAPCGTIGAENALAGMTGAGPITVGVVYQLSSAATVGQTVITTLHAEITYATIAGQIAATSADTTGAETDTSMIDARLDVQSTVVGPTGSSGGASDITWTVRANNGGANPALNLLSPKTLLGDAHAGGGVAIFVPLPVYLGTYLQLTGAPTPTLSGASSGATALMYYNPNPCSGSPNSGWTVTYAPTSECMAIYVYGGATAEFPSHPGTSAGSVSAVQQQVTLAFTTTPPSGVGAGNANTVSLVASGAIGGVIWATGAYPILGQGAAMGTADTATASLLNGIQANTTPSSGIIVPGGASNSISSQAFSSQIIYNGPYLNAAITGSYPGPSNNGAGSASNMLDFTALNVPCTSNSGTGVNSLPCTTASSVIIVNTVQNGGNATDPGVILKATAQTGWKVQLFNVSGCSGTPAVGFIGGSCTQGASITSQSAGTGDTVTAPSPLSIGANATVNYEAVYTPVSTVTPFTIYDATLTATGTLGTGVDTNDTHNDLIPGGVVKLTNSLSVTSPNCPSGESPFNVNVCPSGTLMHSIGYVNIVPFATISNLGGESNPFFASNACYTSAGALVITDDGAIFPSGATAANNWTANTNGIAAAATDTSGDHTSASTIFTYFPLNQTTFAASQNKLTAKIGGAGYQLAPGSSGTIIFSTIVK